jgi:hypothetical protein
MNKPETSMQALSSRNLPVGCFWEVLPSSVIEILRGGAAAKEGPPAHSHLRSNMASRDWFDIKFLESASNVRRVLKKTTGRLPSATIATEIAVCIEQGRSLFELALSAPLQIRPLQLYYGVLSFAKAVIIARTYNSIATIDQTHGLSDISNPVSELAELRLKVLDRGVFQKFSEVVGAMGCIRYYDASSMLKRERKPFDNAAGLSGKEILLKEILARTPGLDKAFKKTFDEEASSAVLDLNIRYDDVRLRISDDQVFTDKESLLALIEQLRRRFPFLDQWCFHEASSAFDQSTITFRNTNKPQIGEFSEKITVKVGNNIVGQSGPYTEWVPFTSILPALAGGITNAMPTAMQPYDGALLSEFSTQFMGCFLLSSLVRYRPQIWQKAISRSVSENSPADDSALALIEQFNDVVFSSFPGLVVHAIDGS